MGLVDANKCLPMGLVDVPEVVLVSWGYFSFGFIAWFENEL